MVAPTLPTIAEESNNEEVNEEYGEPPTFTHPDSLSRLIPKPSGNMVRLACAARGKAEIASVS